MESKSVVDSLVRDAVQARIENPLSNCLNASSTSGSEKLLWTLLKLCVDRGGVLASDAYTTGVPVEPGLVVGGITEAQSPESKIVQLLLCGGATASGAVTTAAPGGSISPGGPTVSVFSGASNATAFVPDMTRPKQLYASFAPSAPTGVVTSVDGNGASVGDVATAVGTEQYAEIEALLVVGRREEALKRAIELREWSLAMLIGCVCGAEKYQEVVRSYASSHFPAAAPLHLLTLMFANQGASAVLSSSSNANATGTASTVGDDSNNLLTLWKHNLSAILSNKASNWQKLARFLGYRLHSETKVNNEWTQIFFLKLCKISPLCPLQRNYVC